MMFDHCLLDELTVKGFNCEYSQFHHMVGVARVFAILCQRSFLQDLVRRRDCSSSLNCTMPPGVSWKAVRALRMMLTNSSYSAGVMWYILKWVHAVNLQGRRGCFLGKFLNKMQGEEKSKEEESPKSMSEVYFWIKIYKLSYFVDGLRFRKYLYLS